MSASPATIPLTLRLAQARNLADAGRMDEAERVLAPSAQALPDEPLALHTLAVIVTRRGDYSRARRLWQQLIRVEPGHREAASMLEHIDVWAARPAWVRFAAPAAAALLVIAVALFAASALRSPTRPKSPATAITPIASTPVAAYSPVTPARPIYVTPATRPTAIAPAPANSDIPAITFDLKSADKKKR